MPPSRKDVLSPANFITITGVCMSVVGSFLLATPLGVTLVVTGKTLDVVDGFVARRTHTSRFGAIMDATADKLTNLAILLAAWYFAAAPLLVVAYVFAQQAIVAVISLIAERRRLNLEVTFAGKINMFVQVAALLLFVIASVSPSVDGPLRMIAWVLASLGVATGLLATYSYIRRFRKQLNKN